jgi:hypothetical protein
MRVTGQVVAHPAAQVVAEVLEQHRVEPEQPSHRQPAQRPVRSVADRVAPLLGHALGAL